MLFLICNALFYNERSATMGNRKDSKGRVLKQGESQRKDGRYSYRYTGSDGKRKEVYAPSLNELRIKEKQILKELDAGIISDNSTLNEYFDRYMATKKELKESTITDYLNKYDLYVRESWLGSKRVKDIKKSDILLFYKEKLDELSGNTVFKISALIAPALELAADDRVIMKNPAKGCSKMITRGKPRNAVPEKELAEFLDHAKGLNHRNEYFLAVNLLLGTGLRVNEALGLTWDDVDLLNGTISVNKQLLYLNRNGNSHMCVGKPKTDSGCRIVPLSTELVEQLKKHKDQTFFSSNCTKLDGFSGFVFHTEKNTPMLGASINMYLGYVVKSYNKTHENKLGHISCHLLRHTFCTRMAKRGMNPHALQYIMGHNNYAITSKYYISNDSEFASEEFLRVCAR